MKRKTLLQITLIYDIQYFPTLCGVFWVQLVCLLYCGENTFIPSGVVIQWSLLTARVVGLVGITSSIAVSKTDLSSSNTGSMIKCVSSNFRSDMLNQFHSIPHIFQETLLFWQCPKQQSDKDSRPIFPSITHQACCHSKLKMYTCAEFHIADLDKMRMPTTLISDPITRIHHHFKPFIKR